MGSDHRALTVRYISKAALIVLAVYLCMETLLVFVAASTGKNQILPVRFIAHALGGIDGHTYTDSVEAFNASYARGFRTFETDLLDASDGIVVFHDLNGMKTEFGLDKHVDQISRRDFLKQRYYGKYSPLALDGLLDLLESHGDAALIIDLKNSSDYKQDDDLIHDAGQFADLHARIFAAISQRDPALLEQIIPQIYCEDDLAALRQIHAYKNVIYTLYRTRSTDDEVIAFVKRSPEIKTVAVERRRFSPRLTKELAALHVATWVYVVNNQSDAYNFIAQGASGIYTDFIPPSASLR